MKIEIPIIEPDKKKGGYWEIYPDRKIWHKERNIKIKPTSQIDVINQELNNLNQETRTMETFKSKKQLDEEKPKFPPLLQEDYNLMISKIEYITQNKYMAKPDKETGSIPQEEVMKISLVVISYKDGELAYDEKGGDAKERILFFTGKPQAMGFMTDGTPSKTRQLLAYATGQNVEEELKVEAWDSLLGKTIFAEVIRKKNLKGQIVNRISRFIAPRQARTKKAESKAETKPAPVEKEESKKTEVKKP